MPTNAAQNEYSLLKKVPVVLRARGYRLYTQNGRRLIDLWLNGGAAILGHTPPNVLREIKNTASRGLYAPFPHFLEARYFKALTKLFPEYSFRLYAAPPEGFETLVKNETAGLWRPFLNAASPFLIENNSPPIIIPVLPGIQSWRNNLPLGLCVFASKYETPQSELPASDILSPVLLAAATRGIYDLINSQERGKLPFPRILKSLKNSQWQRQGIYLNLKEKQNLPLPKRNEEWETLFNQFLDAGFLIPPTPSQPLILPGELSDGEEAKLAALFSPT